jgi:cytoplasmic iron level regulating protein YaaA (DUF328/UPF0246 family)
VWLLLPPSEGKRPGGEGPPLTDPATLALASLGPTRVRVRDAVVRLCRHRPSAATTALHLPPSVADEAVAANAALLDSPTLLALDRYAGVVYAGLDVASLTPNQRRVAEDSVLVFSGLWGLVGGGDRIPDYRVPAAADLPRVGPLTPLWRDALRDALPHLLADRLVVDLRSTDYAAMWTPRGETAARTVAVRVLAARPGGAKVISYHSKHAKGRLARALIARVARRSHVRTADDVVRIAAGLGWSATVTAGPRGTTHLDLVDPSG